MKASLVRAGALLALLATATASSSSGVAPTKTKRANNFVGVQDGEFHLNGNPFFHFSTTAYWLGSLSDDDITTTLTDIAKTGIKVVRTWAFKDVTEVPTDGSVYFQVLANGTATINTGPNGIQRLDKVISEAEKLGLKIQFTLTNNWSVLRRPGDNLKLPIGFLSNDYGGMDAYVRNFVGPEGLHDQFFTNQSLIMQFQNYLDVVVKRYADSTTLFAWEIANDPRCNSTLPNSPTCKTTDVTNWISTVSSHIKTIDRNHIVSAGAGGFMCPTCEKLFAGKTTPPPAGPSPSAGATRRKRATGALLTPARALAIRAGLLRKWRGSSTASTNTGPRIRGRWTAPKPRQLNTQNAAFDGSQGVDAEDIAAVPTVDYSSFQLFPDQNNYMNVDSADTDAVTQAIDSGSAFIQANAQAAAAAGKPAQLSAFGLVSKTSASSFVPFNQSSVTVADVISSSVKTIGANSTQQAAAYSQWIQTAIDSGVSSIGQYQWGQNFTDSTSPLITESPLTSASNTSELSPDDGYATYGDAQKAIFANGASQQTAKNGG